jgi:hypothetical protein
MQMSCGSLIWGALGCSVFVGMDQFKALVNENVFCVYTSPGYELWGYVTFIVVIVTLGFAAIVAFQTADAYTDRTEEGK